MRHIVTLLALLALPTVATAQTEPDFCTGLKRVVAAADEDPRSFASVVWDPMNYRGGRGSWIPAPMESCEVLRTSIGGDRYHCRGPRGPEDVAVTQLVALESQVRRCLGVAGVVPDPDQTLPASFGSLHFTPKRGIRVAIYRQQFSTGGWIGLQITKVAPS